MPKAKEFPMVFDRCPECECPERVIDKAWNQLIDEGRLPESCREMDHSLLKMPVQMYDPANPPVVSCDVVELSIDICAGCGTQYCFKAERKNVPIHYQVSGKKL